MQKVTKLINYDIFCMMLMINDYFINYVLKDNLKLKFFLEWLKKCSVGSNGMKQGPTWEIQKQDKKALKILGGLVIIKS